RLMRLAQRLVDAVGENPDDAPPESLALAREAHEILKAISQIVAAPANIQGGAASPQGRRATAA
ncbi:hypothetical protein Q0L86_14180, partial [Staphylococcus aureus]|nr:hypothetical protein [Staphylococcus aureus]